MTKTYIANRVLYLMSPWGILEFMSQGTGSVYITDMEHIQSFIERTRQYADGTIVCNDVPQEPAPIVEDNAPQAQSPVADDDSPTKVKNAKQAMEWLARNKGEKRGVYSKDKIRELAAKHGVEFVNWK